MKLTIWCCIIHNWTSLCTWLSRYNIAVENIPTKKETAQRGREWRQEKEENASESNETSDIIYRSNTEKRIWAILVLLSLWGLFEIDSQYWMWYWSAHWYWNRRKGENELLRSALSIWDVRLARYSFVFSYAWLVQRKQINCLFFFLERISQVIFNWTYQVRDRLSFENE